MIIDVPTLIRENDNHPFNGVIHIGDEHVKYRMAVPGVLATSILFVHNDGYKLKEFYDGEKFSSMPIPKLLQEDVSKKTFKQIYREQKGRIDLDQYDLIYVEKDPNIIKGFESLFQTFQGIKAIYFRDMNDPDKIFDLDVWLMTYQFDKKLIATDFNETTNKNEYDLFYVRK